MSSDFWRDFSFPSNCDKLLQQQGGCKLEQLLDEDDVVVDAREQKPDLLSLYGCQYVLLNSKSLLKPSSLETMVGYLTKEPTPDSSENVKFRYSLYSFFGDPPRYPAVVCEIFSAKIEPVDKALASNKLLLDLLFSPLKMPNLNGMLGPIILKVITSLISTNTNAVSYEWLLASPC